MRGFARGHSGGENKRPERTISHGEIDPQEWVSLNFIDQCRLWLYNSDDTNADKTIIF